MVTRVSWCLLYIFPETNPAELPTAISHGSHRSHRFHRFHRFHRHSGTWVDFRTEMGRSLPRTSSWSMTAPDWFRPQERVRSWFGAWKWGIYLYRYPNPKASRKNRKKQAFQRKNEKMVNWWDWIQGLPHFQRTYSDFVSLGADHRCGSPFGLRFKSFRLPLDSRHMWKWWGRYDTTTTDHCWTHMPIRA